MSEPRVVAIVLNYNGKALTIGAVDSLRRMTWPGLDVIVVDNGSTDGSYDAVAAVCPDVIQVRKEVNEGPAAGMNLGLTAALADGRYDYILMLNNDIEVDPAMLTELVRVAERDPGIGCVGPKTYYHGDRARIWSAGGVIRFRESVTAERGIGELDRGQYDRDEEVPYLNFCAVLLRREAVAATGLLDPIYRLSSEDADWCMRMKAERFTCWYAHRAVLYHMVSQTVGVYNPKKTFLSGRSMAIFVRRYGGPWQWLTFVLAMLAAMPLAFLRELGKGNQRAVIEKVRGVLTGLRVPMTAPPRAPV